MTFLSLLRVSKSTVTEEVKKVKCMLQQATKTQRGSRGIAVHSFFNLSARRGWVASASPWLVYPRESPSTYLIGG
jgi:hypothetical protein